MPTVRAPSWAARTAISAPNPVPAPVTRTERPSKRRGGGKGTGFVTLPLSRRTPTPRRRPLVMAGIRASDISGGLNPRRIGDGSAGLRSARGQSCVAGGHHRLRPVAEVELGEDVSYVGLHRRHADHELLGDLRVGAAGADQ